ncbi:hypothetical protein Dimus_007908 [Dionaea muscipula]
MIEEGKSGTEKVTFLKLLDIDGRIARARDSVCKPQREQGPPPRSSMSRRLYKTTKDMLLKQRAKDDWLKFMDQNSSYFYSLIKCKRERRWISSILNRNDLRLEDDKEIGEEIVRGFRGSLVLLFRPQRSLMNYVSKEDRTLMRNRNINFAKGLNGGGSSCFVGH